MNPVSFVDYSVKKLLAERQQRAIELLSSLTCSDRSSVLKSINDYLSAVDLQQKPSLDETIEYVRAQPLPVSKLLGQIITLDAKKITDEMIKSSLALHEALETKDLLTKEGTRMVMEISNLNMGRTSLIDKFITCVKQYVEFEIEVVPVDENYSNQFMIALLAHEGGDVETLQRIFKELFPAMSYENLEPEEIYTYLMENYFSC